MLRIGAVLFLSVAVLSGAGSTVWREAACEGIYSRHLQGVCSDGGDSLYWSWTDCLVRTDRSGRLLKRVSADNHHGDLYFHGGRIHVAVNLGRFNRPAGEADSWVYSYDGVTLELIDRRPVPEVVHGAGGIACDGRRFLVVGGLPDGVKENCLYEYDSGMRFVRRHVLTSGHTHLGIQTAEFDGKSWWFGCYGTPEILLRADSSLAFTGRWEFNASVGLVHVGGDRFLVAQNHTTTGEGHSAELHFASASADRGLRLESPSAAPESGPP